MKILIGGSPWSIAQTKNRETECKRLQTVPDWRGVE